MPIVTDVDGDEIVTETQTGVVVTGTGFGAIKGKGTLELWSSTNEVSASGVLRVRKYGYKATKLPLRIDSVVDQPVTLRVDNQQV